MTETMAQRDRLENEVDRLSSVRESSSVEVKKERMQLTGRRAEVGPRTGQGTTHKRSTGEVEQREKDVQYKLDGALARVAQLTSRDTRRQKQSE